MAVYRSFEVLQGQTLIAIFSDSHDARRGRSNQALYFVTDFGVYQMTHVQDCCESVRIEEVHGDPEALRGAFITLAEESSGVPENEAEYMDMSATWTFYRLCTPQGDLTLRWLGESNGYYSEGVDYEEVSSVPEDADLWNPVEKR